MQDTDEKVQAAMQIILHAGDARTSTMEALDLLDKFDIEGAKEKMKTAQDNIVQAHKVQTDAIQDETRGAPSEYSLLFTHAQDTLMTIASEINIAHHLISMTEAIDNRFKALEQK